MNEKFTAPFRLAEIGSNVYIFHMLPKIIHRTQARVTAALGKQAHLLIAAFVGREIGKDISLRWLVLF